MIKIPVTFALLTTTKGHFEIKNRYQQTVESFNSALPLTEYYECLAHIKMSSGDSEQCSEMTRYLKSKGFAVQTTEGNWSHNTASHQINYLEDLMRILISVKTPYVMIVEDDWTIKVSEGQFIDYLNIACQLFETDTNLMQVRIPRWTNELERIRGLMQKHGLNRWAFEVDRYHFRHDDYSANPSIYRTRDLRAAINLTLRTNLDKHVEHGVGVALKFLSNIDTGQFACFNPNLVRIGHLGTPIGQEDDLSKDLIS